MWRKEGETGLQDAVLSNKESAKLSQMQAESNSEDSVLGGDGIKKRQKRKSSGPWHVYKVLVIWLWPPSAASSHCSQSLSRLGLSH